MKTKSHIGVNFRLNVLIPKHINSDNETKYLVYPAVIRHDEKIIRYDPRSIL